MQNVPNLITIGRLLLVPITVWLLIGGAYQEAFWIFLIAGISDAVDGALAKKFDAETQLGSFLDPLADKVLLVSVFVTLGVQGQIAVWLVIMVVFRDLLIICGVTLYYTLMDEMMVMRPHPLSKINTAIQITFVAVILGGVGFGRDVGLFVIVLTYVVAATTLGSGAVYMVRWLRSTTPKAQG